MMGVLRNNVLAKILAFIAAIGLWVYVMSEENPIVEVSYTIPVQLEGASDSYVIDGAPENVRVTISGPRNKILHTDPSTLVATINTIDMGVGRHKVPIHFAPAGGLTTVAISPKNVDLTIDEHAVRYVPIEFKPAEKLDEDWKIETVKATPEQVTISGASAIVNRVENAIVYGKIQKSQGIQELKGAIVLYDAKGNIVQGVGMLPQTATITIDAAKVNAKKTVSVEAEISGRPAKGYEIRSVSAEPNSIEVSGSPSVIDELKLVKTEAIPISGATGSVEKKMPLRFEDGVTSTEKEVLVTVIISKG